MLQLDKIVADSVLFAVQAMSKLKLTSEKIKFIIKTFLDAAHNKKFHGKWMTPDTWAKLIDRYYKPPADNSFDGDA